MDFAQKSQLRLFGMAIGWMLLGALVLWIGWLLRSLWPPFFVAFVFAVVMAPLVDRLETRRWPRPLAAAGVYLIVVSVILFIVVVLLPLVADQVLQIVGDLRTRFHLDQPAKFSHEVAHQIEIFGRTNSIPEFLYRPVMQQAHESANVLAGSLERVGQQILANAPNLIWLVLVPIIAFYVVVDYHRISAKALLALPHSWREEARGIADDVAQVFSKFLRGLVAICFLNGLATILVLLLIPVTRPYAAALGLIAGLLYAIPYLGAIVSTSLIAIVALAAPGGSFGTMIWVILAMILLHQIVFDQVIAPRVLGGQVGLHPVLSILALMAGNILFGISGMLLAVPIAASIQIVILHVMPRMARKIETQPQVDSPSFEQPQKAEARKTVEVTTGEGAVGPTSTAKFS